MMRRRSPSGNLRLSPAAPRRGVLLIVVLGIVVALSLIAYSMSFSVRVHARIADNAVRISQARYLSIAAVEQAMAALIMDTTIVDGVEEAWQNPAYFQTTALGPGSFEVSYADPDSEQGIVYGLEDEAAKINVNVATREMLMALPGMTDSLADALIDWRDPDSIASTFGAESDYYQALPYPYEARNGPLATIRELLLVRGFDETILFGEDANGNGQLDPNEDDGDASPPNDNADGVLDGGLWRLITVYSADRNTDNEGRDRVNIQTASEAELMNAMRGLTREEAQAIVQYRGQNAFGNIADLLNVTGAQDDGQSRGGGQGSSVRSSRQGYDMGNSLRSSRQGGDLGNSLRSSRGGDSSMAGRSGLRPTEMQGRASGSYQGSSVQAAPRSSGSGGQSGGGAKLFDLARFSQWADSITTSDEKVLPGLVNLNTAPLEALAAIPGLDDDIAAQIGLARAAGGVPFQTIGDLMKVDGMTEERFRQAAGFLTTRSFQFRANARSKLSSGRGQMAVEAVLERDENGVRLLYWREN